LYFFSSIKICGGASGQQEEIFHFSFAIFHLSSPELNFKCQQTRSQDPFVGRRIQNREWSDRVQFGIRRAYSQVNRKRFSISHLTFFICHREEFGVAWKSTRAMRAESALSNEARFSRGLALLERVINAGDDK
jgi:hypothetical protein